MSGIIMDPNAIPCPLCGKKFIKLQVKREDFLVCKACKVSVNLVDPMVGRWHELPEEKCPICGDVLKKFRRQVDGFEVIRCDRCKVVSYRGDAEYLPKEG